MNEQLHHFAGNYILVIPVALILTAIWFKIEKNRCKHSSKNAILNNTFLYRLLGFVGLLTFALVYLNKPLPGLEESIIVRPADF